MREISYAFSAKLIFVCSENCCGCKMCWSGPYFWMTKTSRFITVWWEYFKAAIKGKLNLEYGKVKRDILQKNYLSDLKFRSMFFDEPTYERRRNYWQNALYFRYMVGYFLSPPWEIFSGASFWSGIFSFASVRGGLEYVNSFQVSTQLHIVCE